MKKFIFFCISLLIFIPNAMADNIIPNGLPPSEKIPAELVRCDSISNVWLKFNDEIKRVHLIAFDSEDGNLNNEINDYFCNVLNNATTIDVEYDVESKDKYNRELVFIYADDYLIQSDLISKGYGQVNNVQENYKYLDDLCTIQYNAIMNNLGIWQYPDIEEKYCNSGLEIGSSNFDQEKTNTQDEEKEEEVLQSLIFINSGILFLLLLFRRKI